MSTRLRKLAGIIAPRWREPGTCAACGGEFTCGAKFSGCWCSEVKLSDQTRAELKSLYSDCLCRKCLEAAASSTTKSKNEY
ncbi:MAG: cysteine-rich CWC family protein [Pyrinomonadaceae bacterium]